MSSFQKLFAFTVGCGVFNWFAAGWMDHCCDRFFGESRWIHHDLVQGIFILSLMIFSVRSATILIRTKRKINQLLKWQSDAFFPLVHQMQKKTSIPFKVVKHPQPFAFAYGWFRPQILVSEGMMEALHEEELKAVLEHEVYHCRQRDPLKIWFAKSASAGFFYFPLIRTWSKQYDLEKELAADRHAIGQCGLKPLASALLKILEQSSSVSSIHGSAGFSSAWMDVRIDGFMKKTPVMKQQKRDYYLTLLVLVILTICPVYDFIK